MKRCNVCGRENDDHAKFCGGCGGSMEDAASDSVPGQRIETRSVYIGNVAESPDAQVDYVEPGSIDVYDPYVSGNGYDNNYNGYSDYRRPPRNSNIFLILIVVFSILLVFLVGLLIYAAWLSPDAKGDSGKQKSTQSKVHKKSSTTSVKSGDSTQEGSDDLISLPGVDSSNTPDYSCGLDPESYNRVESSDGRFSFYYPEGFFNQVRKNGDDYTFGTKDDSAVLYIRTEPVSLNPADSVRDARDLQLAQLDNGTVNVNISGPVHEDGWAHSVLSGRIKNTSDKWDYYISVSDGEKRYSLEFRYTDLKGSGNISESSYMVDCLYRYCEHSGTGYKVRTYDMYLRGDMGEER